MYLGLLQEMAGRHGCAVHAYVLMTNHVHLLVTPEDSSSAARMMKGIGQVYVRRFNDRQGRTGSLWEGRFRSNLVDSTTYLFRCQQYIEMNPVRAAMVAHPAAYEWSSHASNALGQPSPLLTPQDEFLALGACARDRQMAYRRLFERELSADDLAAIRDAVNGGFALGCPAFVERMEAALGRRVTPGTPGRPPMRNPAQSTFISP